MERDGANPELSAHPDLSVKIGLYTYRVRTADGHSTYSVSDGVHTISEPIHWIFGQRTQTWILERNGHYYETLVSYFPRDNVLAPTPDDAGIKPLTLEEAMGRILPSSELRTCFACHSTNLSANQRLIPVQAIPGITCERCHEGAAKHLSDAAQDDFQKLPMALRHQDAQQISNFCGQCHRTLDAVVRGHLRGKVAVRFQPYRLELSRCFIGNDPRISCISCHDPHLPVDHRVADYDAKCLACHSGATRTGSINTRTCPVAKSDCAGCHMQKVEVAGNHAAFTDHYIRIVRPDEAYPE